MGEVYGYECDMPGTISAPCQVTGVRCVQNGTIFHPDFSSDDIENDYPGEWHVEEISTGSAKIYDIDPL